MSRTVSALTAPVTPMIFSTARSRCSLADLVSQIDVAVVRDLFQMVANLDKPGGVVHKPIIARLISIQRIGRCWIMRPN